MSRLKALLGPALAAIVLGASVQTAGAVILPAVTIDGPSEEIVGFGGVAMAEDGSGGLVYLKRVGGVDHVFVSRYIEGHWLAPIRVDGEEPYAASWPRIGAADGGRARGRLGDAVRDRKRASGGRAARVARSDPAPRLSAPRC